MQLPREEILHACRIMRTIRVFEDRVNAEMATGDIPGAVHLYAGQEASAVRMCMHLDDTDGIDAAVEASVGCAVAAARADSSGPRTRTWSHGCGC